jgi:hypothetical protein
VASGGDGGLDVVVWSDFPDRRPGKLIMLGQCATSRSDWTEKLHALANPKGWFEEFMLHNQPPIAAPAAATFVPFVVGERDWGRARRDGVVLFDRQRIACFAQGMDGNLGDECRKCAQELLEQAIDP